MAFCQRALQVDEACAPALILAGSIFSQIGRRNEAVHYLKKAVRLDPSQVDGCKWLATLLIGADGGTEAVRYGRMAIELAPERADVHAALGLALLGSGDNEGAISSFVAATELSPQMAGAFHNLGVAYQREELFAEAVRAYKQAIALSPSTWETHLHLGRTYLAMDLGEEALDCAEKVLKLNPQSTNAAKLRADAGYAASQGPNGRLFLSKVIETAPNTAFPRALLASQLQEAGQFSEAEEALNLSLDIEPNQGLAYYLLANNRKVTEEDRPTYQKLEQVLATQILDPVERSFGNFALGKAFDDLKDYETALARLDLANGEGVPYQPVTAESDRFAKRTRQFAAIIDAEKIRANQLAEQYDVAPIFIVGMPRSGTTLLEQILSRHPLVGAAGEQSFWRDAGRRIIDLPTGEVHSTALAMAGHRYVDLLQSIAPGRRLVTDKFPSNYVYLGILQMVFPKAKFIHATRHPIDTSLSIYMRPFFALHESGRPRQRIVDAYQVYRQSMEHWKHVMEPGSILDVQYEQLVTDQERVIRSILAHCDLPWEEGCLHPDKGDRRVVTFSKWQVRQPVYTTSVERWRNYEPWLGAFRQLLES